MNDMNGGTEQIDWRAPDPHGAARCRGRACGCPWGRPRGRHLGRERPAGPRRRRPAGRRLRRRRDERAHRRGGRARRDPAPGRRQDPAGGLRLLVVAPGIPPSAPIVAAARAAGVPVWGDVELAWRLRRRAGVARRSPRPGWPHRHQRQDHHRADARRDPHRGRPRTAAVGNVGVPLLDAVLRRGALRGAGRRAVQLPAALGRARSARSRRRCSTSPRTTWTGTARWRPTPPAKGQIYEGNQVACVYNVADPATEQLVRGGRRRGGLPGHRLHPRRPGPFDARRGRRDPGRPGVRRRPQDERRRARPIYDVEPHAPHNIANALAAGALARAYGVPVEAVRDGLRAFRPDPHRIEFIAVLDGADYVDDSKATNTHAAAGLAGRVRAHRVDRGRPGQGRRVRRPGGAGGQAAARSRAARRRPGA